MDDEIHFLGDLQRLEVRPGDVFVLKTNKILSREAVERLRDYLAASLGCENKIIVLGDGMELGVLSRDEAAAG